jgi:uncharacterized protein (DUF302 family)
VREVKSVGSNEKRELSIVKIFIVFVLGVIVGMALLGVVAYTKAGDIMVVEDVSKLGFDETVSAIEENAKAAGWKVPAVHPISKTVSKAGFDVNRVTVVELCKAELAGKILQDGKDGRVTPMMPCRVAVYENEAGDVVIARMNSGLMSKFFGGLVAEVMADAAGENEEMFAPIISP